MRKSKIVDKIRGIYRPSRNAPGWNRLHEEGVSREDVLKYWDFLSDALEDSLGKAWRKGHPIEEDIGAEEPAPPAGKRFSVYAVKLKRGVRKDPRFQNANPKGGRKGCLYVGHTWHSPGKRFEQHQAGYLEGRYVRRFGIRIEGRLTKQEAFASRPEALAEERRYADELRDRGYQVWQQ